MQQTQPDVPQAAPVVLTRTVNFETEIGGKPVAIHVMVWEDDVITVDVFERVGEEWGESLLPHAA